MPLTPGTLWVLAGLEVNPELNGRRVLLTKDEGERVCVAMVEEQRSLRVKRHRLRSIDGHTTDEVEAARRHLDASADAHIREFLGRFDAGATDGALSSAAKFALHSLHASD